MKIDAHQHFWAIARGDYGWLTPDLPLLYRDFRPADLEPYLATCQIDGTILVQAAPTVAETRYMLGLADRHAFILGVVGWVDFDAADAADQIAQLAQNPKLVGLRPMIQDISDDRWMLSQHLDPAFSAMIAHDLTFDALVKPQHLPSLYRLIARYPDLCVVIDHGAKPDIANDNFDAWAFQMTQLATNTKAFCKLSGLVTEAKINWAPCQIAPYIAHLLNVFGPDRLIWGSDWPVVTIACEYLRWHDTAQNLAGADAAIFGGTAQKAYRLG